MTKNKIVVSNNDQHIVPTVVEPVKGKRGRKSKKELMAALNMNTDSIIGTTPLIPSNNENVVLNIAENETNSSNIVIIMNPNLDSSIDHNLNDTDINTFTLLQNFNNFIMANSTFIWWVVWLSNSKNVIAPSKWFGPQGPQKYEDIYEDSWIRI